MVTNFYKDLKKAKVGEAITLDVLRNSTLDYDFNDVSEEEEYRYLGDIEAVNDWNERKYLDVKMDSRIAETGNILCEYKVYFKDTGTYAKGNMQSNYDYLAIISVEAKKIWIIDFPLLKKHYKEGKPYTKDHGEQITYGTLFSLNKARKYNMVVAEITYNEDHYPIEIKTAA